MPLQFHHIKQIPRCFKNIIFLLFLLLKLKEVQTHLWQIEYNGRYLSMYFKVNPSQVLCPKKIILKTARSFYESLWYLLMYVKVIFEGSHPTLKLTKQKMSEIIQVNVPNFFYFDEIPKMTKLGPKNRFWDLKI